jgi:hypothetical protein
MLTPSDIKDTARSWKEKCSEKFASISERNVEDYYSDLSLDENDLKSPKLAPKDPTFGVDAVLKTFYEGKNSNANYFDWVETPPKQMSKRAAMKQDRGLSH